MSDSKFEQLARELTDAGLEATALELYCELADRGIKVSHLEKHFGDIAADSGPDIDARAHDDREEPSAAPGHLNAPLGLQQGTLARVQLNVVDYAASAATVAKIQSQSDALRRIESLYLQGNRDFSKFSQLYFKQQARLRQMRNAHKSLSNQLLRHQEEIQRLSRELHQHEHSPAGLALVETTMVAPLLRLAQGAPRHHLPEFAALLAQILHCEVAVATKQRILATLLRLWPSPDRADRQTVLEIFRSYCLSCMPLPDEKPIARNLNDGHLSDDSTPQSPTVSDAGGPAAILAAETHRAEGTSSPVLDHHALDDANGIKSTVLPAVAAAMEPQSLAATSPALQLLLLELHVALDDLGVQSPHTLMASLERLADWRVCQSDIVRTTALGHLLRVLVVHKNEASLVRYLPAAYRAFRHALQDPSSRVCNLVMKGDSTQPARINALGGARALLLYLLHIDLDQDCLLTNHGVVQQLLVALCDTGYYLREHSSSSANVSRVVAAMQRGQEDSLLERSKGRRESLATSDADNDGQQTSDDDATADKSTSSGQTVVLTDASLSVQIDATATPPEDPWQRENWELYQRSQAQLAKPVVLRLLNRMLVSLQVCLPVVYATLLAEFGTKFPNVGQWEADSTTDALVNSTTADAAGASSPKHDCLAAFWQGLDRRPWSAAEHHGRLLASVGEARHCAATPDNDATGACTTAATGNSQEEPPSSAGVRLEQTNLARERVRSWAGLFWFLKHFLPQIVIAFPEAIIDSPASKSDLLDGQEAAAVWRHDVGFEKTGVISSDTKDKAIATADKMRLLRENWSPALAAVHLADSTARGTANTMLKTMLLLHDTLGPHFLICVVVPLVLCRAGIDWKSEFTKEMGAFVEDDMGISFFDASGQTGSPRDSILQVGSLPSPQFRAVLVHVALRYAFAYAKCPPCHNLLWESGHEVDEAESFRKVLETPRRVTGDHASKLETHGNRCYCLIEEAFCRCLTSSSGWNANGADFCELTEQLAQLCARKQGTGTSDDAASVPSQTDAASVFVFLARRSFAKFQGLVKEQSRILELWASRIISFGAASPLADHQHRLRQQQQKTRSNPYVAGIGILFFLGVVRACDNDGNHVYPAALRALCAGYLVRVDFRCASHHGYSLHCVIRAWPSPCCVLLCRRDRWDTAQGDGTPESLPIIGNADADPAGTSSAASGVPSVSNVLAEAKSLLVSHADAAASIEDDIQPWVWKALAVVVAKDGSREVAVAILNAAYSVLRDSALDLDRHARNVVRLVVLHCLRLEREAVHSNSPWNAADTRACIAAAMPIFEFLSNSREFLRDKRLHRAIKEGVRALLAIIAKQDQEEKAARLTQDAVGEQQLHCPAGHILKPFKVDTRTYTCDECSELQQLYAPMLGCRPCDYDACVSCAKLQADLQAKALAEAEARVAKDLARIDANEGSSDVGILDPGTHHTANATPTHRSRQERQHQLFELLKSDERVRYRKTLERVKSLSSITTAAVQEFFEDTAATLSTITGGLPTTLENADSDKDDGSDSDGSSDGEVIFDVHLSPLHEEEHESQGSGSDSGSRDGSDEDVDIVDLDAVATDIARGGRGSSDLPLKAVPSRLLQVTVPAGAHSGTLVSVQTPKRGRDMVVEVPEGVDEGETFVTVLPASPVHKSSHRGKHREAVGVLASPPPSDAKKKQHRKKGASGFGSFGSFGSLMSSGAAGPPMTGHRRTGSRSSVGSTDSTGSHKSKGGFGIVQPSLSPQTSLPEINDFFKKMGKQMGEGFDKFGKDIKKLSSHPDGSATKR